MRRALTGVIVAVLMSVAPSAQDPQRLFKAAMNTEVVDGDLRRAIEQYRRVVAAGDKALAAEALVRMAGCHEKLGDAEAEQIYQRILRDYSDQQEAVAIAKRRVGTSGVQSRARGDRPVWTGPYVDMFGQVSPDGRFITYVDWVRSMNLMVRDLTTDTERPITGLQSFMENPSWAFHGQAEFSTVSKDGKQVAYAWLDKNGHPYQLRIASLTGPRSGSPRVVFPGSEDIAFLSPFDWSSDGRSIAVAIRRKDGSGQIGLIAVADGALRVLKSVAWSGPERIFFSPDSQYMAYDVLADDVSAQRDIFIMAVDASREFPAVVHPAKDHLMGWSPDGSRLLFTSDRAGTMGLWSLGVSKGRADGSPRLLRDGVNGFSLGVTNAGTLYLYKNISDRDVKIARIDTETGRLVGTPTHFERGFVEGAQVPDWSPDGTRLAYQACNGNCVAIRTVSTGEVRQFHGLYAREPRWSPDGRSLITAARDNRGRNGIFRMDPETGAVTDVVLGPGFGAAPQWSPDGTKIYYRRGPDMIVERDLTSGTEREVARHPLLGPFELSPDGRSIVTRTRVDPTTKRRRLILLPLDGGEHRVLLEAEGQDGFSNQRTTAWTRDSQAVIVLKGIGQQAGLWLVPTTGEAPRKLDIDISSWAEGVSPGSGWGFSLSLDGSRIAFLMGRTAAEVWALEHVLSAVHGQENRSAR